LGGSREGKWKAVRNTFIIFLVSGFWHGARWNFIAWGFIHACGFLPLLIFNRNRQYTTGVVAQNSFLPTIKEVFQMLSTFAFVTLAWIFFRAKTIWEALDYIIHVLKSIINTPSQLLHKPIVNTSEINDISMYMNFLRIFIVVMLDFYIRKNERVIFYKMKNSRIFFILISLFVILSLSKAKSFIYFNF
jgi:D-alanyl-lipoteichoic acid acyltransferase DltB (MBOAT superfamily)